MLDAVYADLPEPAQRAYRHLALLPGPTFSAAAAAAALAADDTSTDTVLAQLSDRHLLQFGPRLDQWQMPEPAAAHARALSQTHDSAGERAAVRARAARHYLMWAARLDTVIAPGRRRYAPVFAWHPERPPPQARTPSQSRAQTTDPPRPETPHPRRGPPQSRRTAARVSMPHEFRYFVHLARTSGTRWRHGDRHNRRHRLTPPGRLAWRRIHRHASQATRTPRPERTPA